MPETGPQTRGLSCETPPCFDVAVHPKVEVEDARPPFKAKRFRMHVRDAHSTKKNAARGEGAAGGEGGF